MRLSVAEQIFGQNKPPLDEVLTNDFADLAAEVDAAVKKISARPVKVKDETDFAAVGDFASAANKLTKRLEETRKDETTPLFQAQKSIKAHFDRLIESLGQAMRPHLDAADSYTRAKAAQERRRREEEARKLREEEEAERTKAETTRRSDVAARAEGRAEDLAARASELESDTGSAADAVRTRTAYGGVATATTRWDFEIVDYDAIDLNKLRPYLARSAVETAIRSAVRVTKQHTSIPGVRVFEDTRAAFR